MTSEPDSRRPLLLSYLAHRRTIGILGMALPFVLLVGGYVVFRQGLQGSLSAYYWTGMRDVFVGTLFVLAFFFMAYRGYDERDRRHGLRAWFFAMCVALFPTPPEDPSTLQTVIGVVHYASAVGLFWSLIEFTNLFQLGLKEEATPAKREQQRKRATLYRRCGTLMTVAVVGLIVYKVLTWLPFVPEAFERAMEPIRPVFLGETVAILAFGFSWFVKGQALDRWKDPDGGDGESPVRDPAA